MQAWRLELVSCVKADSEVGSGIEVDMGMDLSMGIVVYSGIDLDICMAMSMGMVCLVRHRLGHRHEHAHECIL